MPRIVALIFAYFFLALAVVGIFLPVLPTVPFLLLAAWFAARGSEKLHKWLYAHPHLGKILIDWEQNRAISRTSKITAVVMLSISWGILYYRDSNIYLLVGLAIFFIGMSTYLVTRPEPNTIT
jgi:uncharacterized membrane protein YbaN (DUF454 family)